MAVNSELAILLTAKDRASAPLRKLQKQVSGLQKTVDTAGKSFKVLGGLVGVGGAGIGAAAITAGYAFNSFQEQSELAFTTILKDGAKAKAMIAGIQEVAKATPFDTEGLTRATQRLLAFGFKAEDVLPTLMDISDTVSGLGGGTEMLDRVTTAFGQMTAKGKAQTEELMQLAEAGIPVWRILADNIGEISPRLAEAASSGKITQTQLVDQIQKLVSGGKLKAPQAIAMLRKGMAQQFGGLSKLQSQTVGGATSTFKDTLMQLLGDLTKGPFKETAGALLGMADALDRMRSQFKDLPEPIKTVVSWIASIGSVIGGLLTGGAIASLLGALGSGTGLTGILSGLGSFLTGAASPFAILAGAFLVAKMAWDRNFQPILDALQTYLTTFPHVKIGLSWLNDQAKAVADWIMDLGKPLKAAVSVAVTWANDAAKALADWVGAAARSITQTINVAVTWANDAAKALADWANAAAKSVTQTINVAVQWAGDTAAAIGTWIQGAGEAISRTVETTLVWGGEIAAALGDWFAGKGDAISRNVQALLLWGGEVAGALGDWFMGRGDAIARNVSTVLLWAGDVAATLGDWFMGRGEAIGRNVQTYLLWAGDVAGRIGDWILGKGDALGRNIAAHLGWAGDIAARIGGWITDGGNLARTITIDFKWLTDAARKIYEWWTGTGGTVGNGGGRVVNVGGGVGGGGNYAYATGGLALSPQLAMLGENGPEAVIPLSRMNGMGGGTAVYVTIQGNVLNTVQFEDAVVRALDTARRRGRTT